MKKTRPEPLQTPETLAQDGARAGRRLRRAQAERRRRLRLGAEADAAYDRAASLDADDRAALRRLEEAEAFRARFSAEATGGPQARPSTNRGISLQGLLLLLGLRHGATHLLTDWGEETACCGLKACDHSCEEDDPCALCAGRGDCGEGLFLCACAPLSPMPQTAALLHLRTCPSARRDGLRIAVFSDACWVCYRREATTTERRALSGPACYRACDSCADQVEADAVEKAETAAGWDPNP
jgi:hypothetical protein